MSWIRGRTNPEDLHKHVASIHREYGHTDKADLWEILALFIEEQNGKTLALTKRVTELERRLEGYEKHYHFVQTCRTSEWDGSPILERSGIPTTSVRNPPPATPAAKENAAG